MNINKHQADRWLNNGCIFYIIFFFKYLQYTFKSYKKYKKYKIIYAFNNFIATDKPRSNKLMFYIGYFHTRNI